MTNICCGASEPPGWREMYPVHGCLYTVIVIVYCAVALFIFARAAYRYHKNGKP